MESSGRTRTRWSLLAATLGVQAVLLCAGWFWLFVHLRSEISRSIEQFVCATNISTMSRFSELLRDFDTDATEFGTPDWQELQSLVEEFELPAGAYVSLLDDEGRVVCHPRLGPAPAYRFSNVAGVPFTESQTRRARTIGDVAENEVVTGRATLHFGNAEYIATTRIPRLGLQVVAHQPEAGLAPIGSVLTTRLAFVGLLVSAVILTFTGLTAGTLISRFQKRIEDVNHNLEDEVARRVGEALRARNAMIFGLAKLAEYRDTDTGTHLQRICTYSTLLARELRDQFSEITDEWIERLGVAASLHDIGKVGIPDRILLKPGKLDPEERRIMEKHAEIGGETLVAIQRQLGDDPMIEMATRIALGHHERWDGGGYPYSISGEQIPLEARIVSLADVYDALTTKRVYKDAMSHEKATSIIFEGAGTQFDQRIVAAFERMQKQFDVTRRCLQPDEAMATHLERLAA